MTNESLFKRVEQLEKALSQLQRDLRRCLDHPTNELLPHLPTVVTSPDRISLVLTDSTLAVRSKNATVGCVTLIKEESDESV